MGPAHLHAGTHVGRFAFEPKSESRNPDCDWAEYRARWGYFGKDERSPTGIGYQDKKAES